MTPQSAKKDTANLYFAPSTAPGCVQFGSPAQPERLWVVVSTLMTVRAFLRSQLAAVAERHSVRIAANSQETSVELDSERRVGVTSIPIVREIAPWNDLVALVKLSRALRQNRVGVVHSITPKAGLLAMLAGWIAGVPVRVHCFTGQVWATRRGLVRWLLKSCDRVLARFATHLLADSRSQMQFLIREGVAGRDKIAVFGDGSISGVDLARFRPDPETGARTRERVGAGKATVFLYLGRLKREKGVLDLIRAFGELRRQGMDALLLLVGPDEEGLTAGRLGNLPTESGIRVLSGYCDRPEDYMNAADVFCLPSYREGFGSVVIEAAACGTPAVASRIYGLTDAVEEGVSGLLHAPGNIDELSHCMSRLHSDPGFRKQLAVQARRRAVERFSAQRLTEEVLAFYAQFSELRQEG